MLLVFALGGSANAIGLPASATSPPPAERVVLTGSVIPGVADGSLRPSSTVDPSSTERPLTITLTLHRSAEAAFQGYLATVTDPRSPNYHHYLSPAAQASRFGPSLATYDAVRSWLVSQGLTITQGSLNRLTISARGSRGAVESAFSVAIRDFSVNGRSDYANTDAPSLPASIASSVADVGGLANLMTPSQAAPTADGAGTSTVGGNTQALMRAQCFYLELLLGTIYYLTPNKDVAGDIITQWLKASGCYAYLSCVYQASNGTPGSLLSLYTCPGPTGPSPRSRFQPTVVRRAAPRVTHTTARPAKIGLLEFDTFHRSDVDDLLALIGQTSESSLLSEHDVNGGVAVPGPGESEVLLDANIALAVAPGVPVVVYDAPASTTFEQMFQAMVADGDTVISNSWSACEDQVSQADALSIDSVLASAAASGVSVLNGSGDHGSTCLDGHPNTVGVPADSPHATAVGGTLPYIGPGGTYEGESYWDGSTENPQSGSGGFGVSQYFARPSYQNPFSSASGRSVPDIALPADPLVGSTICEADAGGCPSDLSFGGTSAAAPLAAALIADLDQLQPADLGDLNPSLYPLGSTSSFHSATSMNSDFAHVGLGSPDINLLNLALQGKPIGPVSTSESSVASDYDTTSADGSSVLNVLAVLRDANGAPIGGKTITLTPSPGTSAQVTTVTGTSNAVNGTARFKVTDSTVESVTLTATDSTDHVTLTPLTVNFVAPAATGASISGGPAQVLNDGTSQATITVYLENGLGQPASGKTVSLDVNGGSSVISHDTGSASSAGISGHGASTGRGGAKPVVRPAASPTPGNTAVTDSTGNAVFLVTDTTAETVNFTATDVTDGNLPVPGSVSVNFDPDTTTCGTALPVAAAGQSVSTFATGFAYATQSTVFPGNFTAGGCTPQSAPAFDSAGNAYVADPDDGSIYVFPPSGGTPSQANRLPDANFTPQSIGQLVFGKDGSLYAGVTQADGSVSNPEIVQLDPQTGATMRVVASAATGLPDCPFVLAVDPLSGDLFTDDECSGYAASNQISRISDPAGANPAVSDYVTTGGCNLGLAIAPNGTIYLANCNGEVDQIGGTNTTAPTPTKVADVSGVPFSLAVTSTGPTGNATGLDVFGFQGSVTAIDLTQSPAVTSPVATGTSLFFITASSADGCAYGSIPGTIVRVGPPSCGSSPGTTTGPGLSLSDPGVTNPPTGSPVTVTAHLANVSNPAGTPVVFTVEGANPQVKLVDADAGGAASFTYSALHPGVDTVVATTSSPALTSNPVAIHWVAGKDTTFLTLNGSQEIGPVGTAATFAVDLSDVSPSPATPVSGAQVTVSLGASSCNVTTDGSGQGSCRLTPASSGILAVQARYGGSGSLTASTATGSFFAGGPSTAPPSTTPTSSTTTVPTTTTRPTTTTAPGSTTTTMPGTTTTTPPVTTAPTVSVSPASVVRPRSGSTPMTFVVSLDEATGQTVTVRYQTENGTALGLIDFTPESGSASIPAGATSTTVTVPVIGNASDEPDKTFTLVLSSPANATLGTASATGTILANHLLAGCPTSPSADQRYICHLYEDVLGRPAEPAGLAYWVHLLRSGTSRLAVATAYVGTPEARRVFVDRLYVLFLDRHSDAKGLAHWSARLAAGATPDDIRSFLATSAEFAADAGGTDGGFVGLLYRKILGRPADAAAVSYWSAVLRSGVSRTRVVSTLLGTTEARTRIIDDSFLRFLRRNPSRAEVAVYLHALAERGEIAVDADLVASAGYYHRP